MRTRFGLPALIAAAVVAAPVAVAVPLATVGPAQSAVAAAKPRVPKTPKPKPKPVSVTVVGTITAVDPAGSVTMTGLSGHKSLRGKTVTVLVTATTKVRVNGEVGTLDEVGVGYRATAAGTAAGTTVTAKVLSTREVLPPPTETPVP